MGASKHNGFTIIELILFLAISSLLAIALLVGVQTSLDRQRYKDNVLTLKSFLQTQYSSAASIVSDRSDGKKCDTANATISASGGTSRGMSDCVIMGRLIVASDSGSELKAANVLGFRPPGQRANNDADELKLYKLASIDKVVEAEWSALEVETYSFGSGDRIVRAGSHDIYPFRLLILRSPLSGMMLTYVASGNMPLEQIVQAGPVATPQLFCMASGSTTSGFPQSGHMMGVRIGAFATNPSGIDVPLEKDKLCG